MNIQFFKTGSKIHIKKANEGKFTDYCGGKVTDACILKAKQSGNSKLVKRAVFALNARKWKHAKGGSINGSPLQHAVDENKSYKDGYGKVTSEKQVNAATAANMKKYPGISEDLAAGRAPINYKGKKYYMNGDGKLIPSKSVGGHLKLIPKALYGQMIRAAANMGLGIINNIKAGNNRAKAGIANAKAVSSEAMGKAVDKEQAKFDTMKEGLTSGLDELYLKAMKYINSDDPTKQKIGEAMLLRTQNNRNTVNNIFYNGVGLKAREGEIKSLKDLATNYLAEADLLQAQADQLMLLATQNAVSSIQEFQANKDAKVAAQKKNEEEMISLVKADIAGGKYAIPDLDLLINTQLVSAANNAIALGAGSKTDKKSNGSPLSAEKGGKVFGYYEDPTDDTGVVDPRTKKLIKRPKGYHRFNIGRK